MCICHNLFFDYWWIFGLLPVLFPHCRLWDLSSPTRNQTWVLAVKSVKSQPLNCKGTLFISESKYIYKNVSGSPVWMGLKRQNDSTVEQLDWSAGNVAWDLQISLSGALFSGQVCRFGEVGGPAKGRTLARGHTAWFCPKRLGCKYIPTEFRTPSLPHCRSPFRLQ